MNLAAVILVVNICGWICLTTQAETMANTAPMVDDYAEINRILET